MQVKKWPANSTTCECCLLTRNTCAVVYFICNCTLSIVYPTCTVVYFIHDHSIRTCVSVLYVTLVCVCVLQCILCVVAPTPRGACTVVSWWFECAAFHHDARIGIEKLQ